MSTNVRTGGNQKNHTGTKKINTIAAVARCNNKKNKTRSMLIMAAIFLSSVLLTVICTFAYGLIKMEKANVAIMYGSHYGTFQSVDAAQLQEIRRHGEFSEIGLIADAGRLDLEGNTSLMMLDEHAREMSNLMSRFSEGTFPEAENEVAAQKEFFVRLGYEDVRIGDTVTLSYRPDQRHPYEPRQFTVSGFLNAQGSEQEKTVFMVCVSQAFYEAQYPEEARRYSVPFRLGEDVLITFDDAEEVIEELAAECGIKKEWASVNTIYLVHTLDPGMETISVCFVIACLVIVFSVIVIYNIFQVGIAQNIREYGKIRALGATKKQMRRLIRQEGLLLAARSIPAGIAVGYIISWGSFQWLIVQSEEASGMERVPVRFFSLPMLLLAAGLALLTVLLALRRPMKIVSKISPVEAFRYTEGTGSVKAGMRKGRKNMSVRSLAVANIAADRNRTVMTIFTMGLSCVLFVVLSNCVGNLDSDFEARGMVEYGQFQIELSYSMNDEAYPENNLDSILQDNPLNDDFVEQIRAINGVTEVKRRDILLAEINGQKNDVAVLDEEGFAQAKYQSRTILGEVDFRNGMEQDNFYYCWSYFLEENGFELQQQLTAEVTNGTEKRTVNGKLAGSFAHGNTDFVITQGMYERMGLQGATTGWLWVDCKEEDVPAVRTELEQLLYGMEHVEMNAYEQALKSSETAARISKVACYLFLVILGLIGFMNLANTMIMNIITKKQEYGILQAVGMTNKQLNASLQLQGLLFSGGTVLVAVMAGLPIGYAIFCYCREKGFFGLNVYHIPVAEILCMVAAVGLLQAALSFLLSRNLKKESLVERIRYQE